MSELVRRIQRELQRPPLTPLQRWVRRVVLVVLAIVVPLMAVEIVLRTFGYVRPQIRFDIQRATNAASAKALNTRFATDGFVPDRYLLWSMRPGSNFCGLSVDKNGMLQSGPSRFAGKKAYRVLCLGDSTSAYAYLTYPEIARNLLDNAPPERQVEFFNGATAGFTTEQALRRLPRLARLKPSMVVVCFGWNDQFPALNLPDKELGARNAFLAAAHRVFYRSRLYQLIAAPSDARWSSNGQTTESLRVPPDEFRRNLQRLVRDLRAVDAVPVLVTQPENLNRDNEQFLVGKGFAPRDAVLIDRHRAYNQVVRDVAAATKSALLDLEEAFDFREKDLLFEPDGMHFNGPGHNLVARLLVGVLREQNVITRQEFDKVVNAARYNTIAPDKIHARWSLGVDRVTMPTTGTASVSILAKNTGNTVWLKQRTIKRYGVRTNVKHGGVSILGTWLTEQGMTSGTAAITPLAHDLLPGESTSTTLAFAAPAKAGGYAMSVQLAIDCLGELKPARAEITTLTVTVTP